MQSLQRRPENLSSLSVSFLSVVLAMMQNCVGAGVCRICSVQIQVCRRPGRLLSAKQSHRIFSLELKDINLFYRRRVYKLRKWRGIKENGGRCMFLNGIHRGTVFFHEIYKGCIIFLIFILYLYRVLEIPEFIQMIKSYFWLLFTFQLQILLDTQIYAICSIIVSYIQCLFIFIVIKLKTLIQGYPQSMVVI